jgi:hypothetical protein
MPPVFRSSAGPQEAGPPNPYWFLPGFGRIQAEAKIKKVYNFLFLFNDPERSKA